MGLEPEKDITAHVANIIGSLTSGSDLYAGPVMPAGYRDVPARAVFIYPTGGPRPIDFCGEARAERRSRMQIRTRGDKGDFANTLALARQVRDAVHRSDETLTSYIQIMVLETEPIPLGKDDKGFPEYSNNVEALFTE